jgi:CHAT domain-containing protein
VEPADAAAAAIDDVRATALFGDVTSKDLVTCVHRFDDQGSRGLLVCDGSELDEEIDRAHRLLGRAFGADLVAAVRSRGAQAVRIVSSGILATLPVSTALVIDPASAGGALRPLSETLTVSLSPSARVHSVCRTRADQRAADPVRLVCAADPQADDPLRALRWSRWEARAIAQLYGAERSQVAEGAAATKAFLIEHAGTASHLHLALHGYSDPGEAMRSGIGMADGVMTAAEFDGSTELVAKLVVVSACESGRISIGEAPNEFRGLPFALMARGAASVVAALWPVDDRATSLLMVRFHEELVRLESAHPFTTDLVAEALQAAQNWLRTATVEDLTSVPTRLAPQAGTDDRTLADRDARDLSASALRAELPAGRLPFSAPRHWAGFVAIG